MADYGSELEIVQAEVVALQAVLIAISRRLASDHPEVGRSICAAFDEAETLMSGIAMKMGRDVPMAATVGALRIIDEIRTAVIRDEAICTAAEGSGSQRV